ncbi:ATP-binding protein [Alloacidobacterium dinghuense]|uniref:ATP-binding protein n=2 Tax=Alloacidobacterium dinghuense TaxID=2763107 RepID=A0A7G8BR01_9BACT|nr:ATP-binding protein [Alloacidobacterium dinghuense]
MKGYDNVLASWLWVKEEIAGQFLLSKAGLSEVFEKENITWKTLKELHAALVKRSQNQAQAFTAAQTAANALPDADAKAKALDDAQLLQETAAAKTLREHLASVNNTGITKYIYDKYLVGSVPKFLYFDEYYQMEGQLNIEQLKQRQASNTLYDSDRPMIGLIDLARLNLDQLISTNRTEALLNKLEGTSNHLTKQVLKYWSQNRHLSVRFDVRPAKPNDPPGMQQGTNLWGLVYDSVHSATTRLGTRSKGFVWFFSFLAWFSQQRKTGGKIILLLDEPGLALHGTAQGDLLRYIEKELKPHHQVVYTTHSPFMVDSKHFDRVRVVEDKSTEIEDIHEEEIPGTKVYTDVLEVSEGSLFPLQGALGDTLSQTLFVGPNILIVEGVSDLLFLQTVSPLLESLGREGLSLAWTITPVGGSDKVPTFAALLGSQQDLNVATLIDIQQKDKQSIDNLYKKKLLQQKNVLTFADFIGKKEADIEDMFEADFYLKLVNAEYKATLQKPITLSDLPKRERVLASLDSYLQTSPLKDAAFNHYRPSRYFAEHIGTLATKLSPETLDRFEAAFKRLNALL